MPNDSISDMRWLTRVIIYDTLSSDVSQEGTSDFGPKDHYVIKSHESEGNMAKSEEYDPGKSPEGDSRVIHHSQVDNRTNFGAIRKPETGWEDGFRLMLIGVCPYCGWRLVGLVVDHDRHEVTWSCHGGCNP